MATLPTYRLASNSPPKGPSSPTLNHVPGPSKVSTMLKPTTLHARVRACQPSGVFTQLIPHVSNHACTRAAKLRRASVGTRKLQQKQCAGVRPAVEFLAVGASVPLEVVLIVHHEAGELGFKRLPRAPESACDGAHVSAQSGPREKLSRRENMSMEGRLLCVRQEHSAIRTCGTAGRPNHQMVNVREHLPG
jgi:hypothetical protein